LIRTFVEPDGDHFFDNGFDCVIKAKTCQGLVLKKLEKEWKSLEGVVYCYCFRHIMDKNWGDEYYLPA